MPMTATDRYRTSKLARRSRYGGAGASPGCGPARFVDGAPA